MKKLILISTILLGIASMAFADPRIIIPETKWDFGYVPQHGVLTHDYWIRNAGDDTLKIIKVKPG